MVTSSRKSGVIADFLRQQIASGKVAAGSYLPSERMLMKEHELSLKTVRRALRQLEEEALIVVEGRRGYRVLLRANDPNKGCPLAYIVSKPPQEGSTLFYGRMQAALQSEADKLGIPLLGINRNGRTSGEVAGALKTARCFGAIIDGVDVDLVAHIQRLGIPLVMADAWSEAMPLDAVAQDGFVGAFLAADYLASRGHQRIAFFGYDMAQKEPQILERFGGAVSGLARHKLQLAPELCIETAWNDAAATLQCARELLSRKDRPAAIVAPWTGIGTAVVRAAHDVGLVIGKDVELVGWAINEDYDAVATTYPVAVWSMSSLADVAITRLLQRRACPSLAITLTRVPMHLRFPS